MTLSRQLSSLPHGHESRSQPGGDHGSEEEPTGIEADDDVDLVFALGQGLGEEVVHEMGHQGLGREGVSEDGLW